MSNIREGRLGREFDKRVAEFSSSLGFDMELLSYEVLADMAHTIMLYEEGIMGKRDAKRILGSLKELHEKGFSGLELKPVFEDIHMAVEQYILKREKDSGGRMHTARSRNDLVATELRMKTRDAANLLSRAVIDATVVLLKIAEKNTDSLMPAFTHLQHAQPTTMAHHMLSYVDSFLRSLDRIEEGYMRADLCPLGSGAVTTTSFPINRARTRELLGFEGLLENSMDAVSSRDYMIEFAGIAAMVGLDTSKLVEELILWSTPEFGYIELSDSHASTSSIMPQKKNPDILEIIRARTAVSIGSFTSLSSILRSLPQSYNRDLQELSPIFFTTIEGMADMLSLLSNILSQVKIDVEAMAGMLDTDFSTATELADTMVREKGLPFRTAHQIVGRLVSNAAKEGFSAKDITPKLLDDASIEVMGKKIGLSKELISSSLDPGTAVNARSVIGGPASKTVKEAIKKRFSLVAEKERRLLSREKQLIEAKKIILERIGEILEE